MVDHSTKHFLHCVLAGDPAPRLRLAPCRVAMAEISCLLIPNLLAISSCVIDGQSRMAWATRRSNSSLNSDRAALSCFLSSSFGVILLI